MTRKRVLGKGLDALIPAADGLPTASGGIMQISVDEIRPNPRQPRGALDPEELEDLSTSIREHGVLQPLLVTRPVDRDGFELIAGHRRLQAARMAGLRTVPAILRLTSDEEQLELALIENLQRTDLNALEAAEGYRRLADDFGLSHEAIAGRVGKSRVTISNTLRLLKLPEAVRRSLAQGAISEGHARALLSLPTAQAQTAALQAILRRGLNVRQTEELIRRLAGAKAAARARRKRAPEESDLEEQLRQSLGTRVTLRRGRNGGSLVIRFYSDEELNALVDQLLGTARVA